MLPSMRSQIPFTDEVGPAFDRPPRRRAVPERGDAEAGAAPPHHVVRVHRAGLLHPEGMDGFKSSNQI